MPNTADYATLSAVVFYDIGFAVEAFGYENQQEFVPSLFNASSTTFLTAYMFMLVAPWAFHIGSHLVTSNRYQQAQEPRERLKRNRQVVFYVLTTAVALPLCLAGSYRVVRGDQLWTAREETGQAWGVLIIILYLPLHFLAFYVRQADSRNITGRVYSAALAVGAVCSTLSIGQRTNALLPFLIICLFGIRMSVLRITVAGAIFVTLAGALLPWFKWQHSTPGTHIEDQVSAVVNSDLSRTAILGAALDESLPLGTRVLPYSMSGYVYSLLFYVPRSIAPFKGVSSATYFTALLSHTNPMETDWILGIGAIEEAILNLGTFLVVPAMLLYGACFGWLDRLSLRFPSLVVPTRLGALWVCDHHLPAILLMFGTMALFELMMEFSVVEPA